MHASLHQHHSTDKLACVCAYCGGFIRHTQAHEVVTCINCGQRQYTSEEARQHYQELERQKQKSQIYDNDEEVRKETEKEDLEKRVVQAFNASCPHRIRIGRLDINSRFRDEYMGVVTQACWKQRLVLMIEYRGESMTHSQYATKIMAAYRQHKYGATKKDLRVANTWEEFNIEMGDKWIPLYILFPSDMRNRMDSDIHHQALLQWIKTSPVATLAQEESPPPRVNKPKKKAKMNTSSLSPPSTQEQTAIEAIVLLSSSDVALPLPVQNTQAGEAKSLTGEMKTVEHAKEIKVSEAKNEPVERVNEIKPVDKVVTLLIKMEELQTTLASIKQQIRQERKRKHQVMEEAR